MNIQEAREFQNSQAEVVARLGAFLVSLNAFRNTLVAENSYNIDLSEIRKLQPIVSDFMSRAVELNKFYTNYHYQTYYKEISRAVTQISTMLGNQTLQSKQLKNAEFLRKYCSPVEAISEVMLASAQIVISSIDANIKAGDAFTAYLFFSALFSSTLSELTVIDPYMDQSLFDRYLFKLNPRILIKLVTDNDNLKGIKLSQFESVEKLFKIEYPKYQRESRKSLHDRYLITDTHAYSLGGSLKDAAIKSDFSVTELSDQKRQELVNLYA